MDFTDPGEGEGFARIVSWVLSKTVILVWRKLLSAWRVTFSSGWQIFYTNPVPEILNATACSDGFFSGS